MSPPSNRSSRPWNPSTAWPNASGSWTGAWSAKRTSRSCGSARRVTWWAHRRAGCAITKRPSWKIRLAGGAGWTGSALRRAPRRSARRKYVLCRSAARAEKERAMLQRQSDALTLALVKIDAWLRRAPQTDQEAVGRRIGRALGKYPAAAAIIQVAVQRDATGRAVGLKIASDRGRGAKSAPPQRRVSCLRTNCEETDPAQLWRWYIQLTQAEAAFRTAKSDLGLRPVFHHKEDRVQAHLLVCFLALALWRTLEQWMQSEGLGHLRPATGQTTRRRKKRGCTPAGPTRQRANRTAPARRRHARTRHRPVARSPRPAPAKRPARHRECSAENHPEICANTCTATTAFRELTNSG
jgi:hypothetical protein